jgi:hypothetical protein
VRSGTSLLCSTSLQLLAWYRPRRALVKRSQSWSASAQPWPRWMMHCRPITDLTAHREADDGLAGSCCPAHLEVWHCVTVVDSDQPPTEMRLEHGVSDYQDEDPSCPRPSLAHKSYQPESDDQIETYRGCGRLISRRPRRHDLTATVSGRPAW